VLSKTFIFQFFPDFFATSRRYFLQKPGCFPQLIELIVCGHFHFFPAYRVPVTAY